MSLLPFQATDSRPNIFLFWRMEISLLGSWAVSHLQPLVALLLTPHWPTRAHATLWEYQCGSKEEWKEAWIVSKTIKRMAWEKCCVGVAIYSSAQSSFTLCYGAKGRGKRRHKSQLHMVTANCVEDVLTQSWWKPFCMLFQIYNTAWAPGVCFCEIYVK